MPKRTLNVAPLAATLAALVVGCGEDGAKLVPVSGTVTLNGKPVEGAIIAFQPDPSHPTGKTAEDVTGPEGNFKAMTNNRSGVIPGKYNVVITIKPPEAKLPLVHDDFKDDQFMNSLSNAPKGKARPLELEEIFSREVSADGSNELDFDLKGKTTARKG